MDFDALPYSAASGLGSRAHATLARAPIFTVRYLTDLESGAYIGAALAAEMERDYRRADRRTRSQRRWDALTNLCRRALDAGEVGASRAMGPHVSVIVDVQRFGVDPVVAEVLDGPSQILDTATAKPTNTTDDRGDG